MDSVLVVYGFEFHKGQHFVWSTSSVFLVYVLWMFMKFLAIQNCIPTAGVFSTKNACNMIIYKVLRRFYKQVCVYCDNMLCIKLIIYNYNRAKGWLRSHKQVTTKGKLVFPNFKNQLK